MDGIITSCGPESADPDIVYPRVSKLDGIVQLGAIICVIGFMIHIDIGGRQQSVAVGGIRRVGGLPAMVTLSGIKMIVLSFGDYQPVSTTVLKESTGRGAASTVTTISEAKATFPAASRACAPSV